jgi:hypothetical protein
MQNDLNFILFGRRRDDKNEFFENDKTRIDCLFFNHFQ